jgi:glucosylceramidase
LTLSVNRSVSFQQIKGFGGAITDAAGANIYSLSTKATQKILNAYFSPSSGIEYNILRIPLAGTDFSLREYSYADNSTDDFDLKNFSLQAEDIKWKIPFTQAAIEMSQKKISLFASPWSAPKWMKVIQVIRLH